MNTNPNRLVLAVALSLGAAGVAQAVTLAGSATPTAAKATQETVTTGTVTSVSAERGIIAISGRVYPFTPNGLAYSDDRKKPEKGGLSGLKPGTRVTVRSVGGSGGLQAIQIVARD
jgi:hypothetical protein